MNQNLITSIDTSSVVSTDREKWLIDELETLRAEMRCDGKAYRITKLECENSWELSKAFDELAAYKKAKAENDERFMLERDAAREECERLKELYQEVLADYDGMCSDNERLRKEFEVTQKQRDYWRRECSDILDRHRIEREQAALDKQESEQPESVTYYRDPVFSVVVRKTGNEIEWFGKSDLKWTAGEAISQTDKPISEKAALETIAQWKAEAEATEQSEPANPSWPKWWKCNYHDNVQAYIKVDLEGGVAVAYTSQGTVYDGYWCDYVDISSDDNF